MSRIEHEREFAFQWYKKPTLINKLSTLKDWSFTEDNYEIVDSIYDTRNFDLARQKTGVRIRTKKGKTTLTIKKFLGQGPSSEGLYDEHHKDLKSDTHPQLLSSIKVNLIEFDFPIEKQYQFNNRRHQVEFTKPGKLIRLVNETIIYSSSLAICSDNLIEVEFEGVDDSSLVDKVRSELLSRYKLQQIHEGKTDRARRLLAQGKDNPLVQNINDVKKQRMHAHGGKGFINMWFFHQPYSRFDSKETIPVKIFGYEDANWDFFAYAELPVGSEVKKHLHDKTDEIYFIIEGAATINVGGSTKKIKKGDCILTKKGSSHSLTKVTKTLKFIAIEVYG